MFKEEKKGFYKIHIFKKEKFVTKQIKIINLVSTNLWSSNCSANIMVKTCLFLWLYIYYIININSILYNLLKNI